MERFYGVLLTLIFVVGAGIHGCAHATETDTNLKVLQRIERLLKDADQARVVDRRASDLAKSCRDHCNEAFRYFEKESDTYSLKRRTCFDDCDKSSPWPSTGGGC